MKALRKPGFVLGGMLVITGILLNRIATRHLDSNPRFKRRLWERLFIASGLFVVIGIFIAGAGA